MRAESLDTGGLKAQLLSLAQGKRNGALGLVTTQQSPRPERAKVLNPLIFNSLMPDKQAIDHFLQKNLQCRCTHIAADLPSHPIDNGGDGSNGNRMRCKEYLSTLAKDIGGLCRLPQMGIIAFIGADHVFRLAV